MFTEFLRFELSYRLRALMPYIFFFIIGLMIFGAVVSDDIVIGGDVGNVNVNAPYTIVFYAAIMGILGMLIVTAFVNTSALRDDQYAFREILFTNPLQKFGYLGGRFTGAFLVSLIPFLGVYAGILIGCLTPWVEADKIGPFMGDAYVRSFLFFIIPNTFFIASVVFTIAIWSRSAMAAYIGTLVVLVGYILSGTLLRNLDNEFIASLLDPFGVRPFSIMTKYWTPDERNTRLITLTGDLLLNRLLWIGIGIVIWIVGYMRFSFSAPANSASRFPFFTAKSKKNNTPTHDEEMLGLQLSAPVSLPTAPLSYTFATRLHQFFTQVKIDFLGIVRSTPFIILVVCALLNMWGGVATTTQNYGLSTHPVTYNMVDIIGGSMYIFLISIFTFFSGALIWKERESKMDEIYDALPYPTAISYLAKYTALVGIILLLIVMGIGVGVLTQAIEGYTHFELPVYFNMMIVFDGLAFAMLAALAMTIQVLVNNRYVGYFIFIAFVIANSMIWNALDIESHLVQFGSSPRIVYSDMNHYGPFVQSKVAFLLYWMAFTGILTVISILFWIRGRSIGWKERWGIAKQRFQGKLRLATVILVGAWLGLMGFNYYNTKILNTYKTGDAQEALQVKYEQTYKKYENLAQPRIVSVHYVIDLFPKERDVYIKADMTVKNKQSAPIQELHFTMPMGFKAKLIFSGATLVLNDSALHYRIYKLAQPLQPGDSLMIKVESEYVSKGFENEVSNTNIVENGSFFNNADFMPQIGYQESMELSSKDKRKEHKLPVKPRMPQYESPCGTACNNHYISNNSDWVKVDCIISTSDDQIAIAPGTLVKEWKAQNRKYYHYVLEDKVLNFYSFLSARYEVKKDKWQDVDIEIYYTPGHTYNVDKMVNGVKDALSYYTANFGPYPRKQARIIEFPRYASFAQAFPGTMPYSESIGFIARIEKPEDIDMVYYVVAHEMAHQWWAHQVIGANMQGSTILSETFAQYSALMVMEKKYGKDQMKKFLKYELDSYLKGRAGEVEKEQALLYNENQPYIHYNKGSVVMYALREYIGESAVNQALKSLRDSVAYKDAPYPNSSLALHFFKKATPDSLQYLVKDMFEEITLYSNRATKVTSEKLPDGKYKVSIAVEAHKFKADSLGHEKEVALTGDWVEIGVYGKAAEGQKEGKLLTKKKERLTQNTHVFSLITDEEPEKGGIDINHILVDRVMDDNVKKVELN